MFGFWNKKADSPDADAKPFQAVVPERAVSPDVEPPDDATAADESESVEDLEAAYLRALEAVDSVGELAAEVLVEARRAGEDGPDNAVEAAAAPTDGDDEVAEGGEPVDDAEPASSQEDAPRVTPRQIVEALLFVGGRPLTSRQVSDVLGGSNTPDRVDDLIADLNSEYSRQQRPYEVRLVEGGYRLQLMQPFEKVRARVFGVGPREVKLAQNALEVLALVAYQQPVTRDEVAEAGIPGAAGLLRQLLRRRLIELHRGEEGGVDTYQTTDRFLDVFGLRSLGDLPRPEAVSLR